jgi:hypothetical protein
MLGQMSIQRAAALDAPRLDRPRLYSLFESQIVRHMSYIYTRDYWI